MTRKQFGPYAVELTREDKVLFPRETVTKGDLVRYYQDVSKPLLTHIRDRPLTLQRFPDGIEEEGFFQKQTPDYFPDWLGRVRVPLENGGSQNQVTVSNAAGLTYLANQGVITLHTWLSRKDDLRAPDRMVFDLDPPGNDFGLVRDGARALKNTLESLGLPPFLMITGSSGAHVWVPLRRGPDFEAVRAFARSVADHLVAESPRRFTKEVRKTKRKGRLFLDVARNALGQTTVAPYSVHPYAGAPAATPLDWEELNDDQLNSRAFTIRSLPRRISQREDPWRGMGRHRTGLGEPRKRLGEMEESPHV
ncbi:MAG: non-homologous end-joining DNA ligase [Gemmatimonadota bacterium]